MRKLIQIKIKKFATFSVLLISSCSSISHRQTIARPDTSSFHFIQSVIPINVKGYLSTGISDYTLNSFRESIKKPIGLKATTKDSIYIKAIDFSNFEKFYIDSCLTKFQKKNFRWSQGEIEQSKFKYLKLIDTDTISWRKYDGNNIHTFVPPIFLRNNTVCLFYDDFTCGSLCGEGQLSVYKKDGNKWKLFMIISSWIS